MRTFHLFHLPSNSVFGLSRICHISLSLKTNKNQNIYINAENALSVLRRRTPARKFSTSKKTRCGGY